MFFKRGIPTQSEGVSTRSDPFGGAYDLNGEHFPKDILPYQGAIVKCVYQKKEICSRFLKGNRRIRPHPVRCTAVQKSLHLCSRFFFENVPGFQKNFSIFLNFFGAPRHVRRAPRSSAALVQVPSPYRYVFFVENQRVSRNFFDFFVFLESPAASAAHPFKRRPVQAVSLQSNALLAAFALDKRGKKRYNIKNEHKRRDPL